MPQQRRKRQLDLDLSPAECLVMNKRSRKNCIENFSNELIFSIFDYLDGYDIYQSFYQLNHRFRALMTDSSMLLKVNFANQSKLDLFQAIPLLDDRISSFVFQMRLSVKNFFINRSFPNLQSISLYAISPFEFLVYLFYLQPLPRLSHLTISFDYCDVDLGDIYQILFQFTSLKYLNIDVNDDQDDLTITMPYATPSQFSPLERLAIHSINIDEVAVLLSYLPCLSHFSCTNSVGLSHGIQPEVSLTLVNLVHLSVCLYKLEFAQFEKSFLRFCSNLKSLDISIDIQDRNYLDAHRWEQIIVQSLPRLNRFRFRYTDVYDHHFQVTSQHLLIHQFTSSFWRKRHWNLHIHIEDDEIIYQIIPQRKIWFNQEQSHLMNDWNALDIWNSVLVKKNQTFLEDTRAILQSIRITSLDIDCNRVSSITLIRLLHSLPDLHSIRIATLPLKRNLLNRNGHHLDQWNLFIKKNKIRYVTLSKVSDLSRLDLIVELFPLVEHLTLEIRVANDFESALQNVLSKLKRKKNVKINSICFIVARVDNDQTQRLEQLINSKKLLKKFTFIRESDKFYLKWK